MIIVELTLTGCFLNLIERLEQLSIYGATITIEMFVELIDEAFIDSAYRDMHELDLYDKLSGSVPTDPLVSMLSSTVSDLACVINDAVPTEYQVTPERIEYHDDSNLFRLYWRRN